MSKSEKDSRQDSANPDQDKVQEHITKAESFCQAAEFDEALKELGKAREIYPELENINQVEAEIKATAEKYKAEIFAVREALSKKEFSKASSACQRASNSCPQAEVTKSLEHKIKLEQAVQSGSERRERAERGRRRMSAVIKAIGIGALVVVVVAVLFVSVSYLKNISWGSRKEQHVTIPKTPVKTDSKKQELKLEEKKREVKAKRPKTFRKLMAEGANYEAKKDWENAIKTYKKALAIKPDSKKAQDSFVNLCLAKAKANDSKKNGKVAMKALEELLRVNPNHVEAKQLHKKISAYYAIENPLWWIDKAKATVASVNFDINRGPLDAAIAGAQARAGDMAGAKASIEKIGIIWSEYMPYARIVLAEEQAKFGDIEGAINTIKKDLSRGTVGRSLMTNAYCAVASARVEAGDTKGAETIAYTAGSNRISAVYGAIVRSQVKMGDFLGANATIVKIRNKYEMTKAYCNVAIAQAKTNNMIDARKAIKQAKTTAMYIKNDADRALSYFAIARSQAEMGDIENAKTTFNLVNYHRNDKGPAERNAYYVTKFTKAIIDVHAGNLSKAKTMAEELRWCILGIDIYKAIAYAEAKAGNIIAARNTIKKAFQAAWSENRFVTAIIIEAMVEIEDMVDINIMAASQTPCNKYQRYAIAKALTQNHKTDLNELVKWVELLKGHYHDRVYAYLGVADGLSEWNINTNE